MKKRFIGLILMLIICIFLIGCNHNSGPRFTTDELLYDFDYMIQFMEDTFPLFGVTYRRLGVDIRALAESTREMIENYPDSMSHIAAEKGIDIQELPVMDDYVFWSIVQNEFFSHIAPVGNAAMLDFREREELRAFYVIPAMVTSLDRMQQLLMAFDGYGNVVPFHEIETTGEGLPLFQHNRDVFDASDTVTFYRHQQEVFETLAEENPELFNFIFRQEILTDDEPLELFSTERFDGNIAYISVNSFLAHNFRDYSWRIDRFFMDIQEYDHLIIDIRENTGGRMDFWRMLIMFTLWNQREQEFPAVHMYSFFNDTPRAYELALAQLGTERFAARFVPQSDRPVPIGEILEQYDLPMLNSDDLRSLGYGVRQNASVGLLNQNNFHFTQERMWIPRPIFPFEGRIWLLTSEQNVSAAAHFAYHAKYIEFATLVGEPPGGGMTSTVMTHFNLPNTGIMVRWDIDYVTDSEGRSLEEFTVQPHYSNRPGMDALETVLAMIEEQG